LIWRTKHWFARIATQNLFLPKGNRLSTRKKALKMNPKDARIAEKQESNKEILTVAAMATDGKIKKRA
jgi:hypothetical protein